jgi:rare lipoprotein A
MARLVAVLFALIVIAVDAEAAETGKASWYGSESGSRTASGERFDPDGLSCAHRRHPFGTTLKVTDLKTGKFVLCRVSDRGPMARTGRIVDLSRGAAKQLGILRRGVALVSVAVVH